MSDLPRQSTHNLASYFNRLGRSHDNEKIRAGMKTDDRRFLLCGSRSFIDHVSDLGCIRLTTVLVPFSKVFQESPKIEDFHLTVGTSLRCCLPCQAPDASIVADSRRMHCVTGGNRKRFEHQSGFLCAKFEVTNDHLRDSRRKDHIQVWVSCLEKLHHISDGGGLSMIAAFDEQTFADFEINPTRMSTL